MLSDERWLLPEGIDEVLPTEAERLEILRREILDLFAGWGYRLVIPPFIEFIESLLIGTGRELDLQTFKLIDQTSGRLMGVRADMTPQVARIDARTGTGEAPARLCYLGTVLHTQSDHLEKSRSPMQLGAELYGHDGHASDLEIIRLLLEMLSLVGLSGFFLDLGHVGIYRGLVDEAGLSERQEAELFAILQRKALPELDDYFTDQNIPRNIAPWFAALADLHGGAEVIAKARRRLQGAGDKVHRALDELEAIAAALAQRMPQLPIHFDLAELRGYHYQSGVVFAAFVPGYGREIARGGRYNEIGQAFGRARPATGFSADLRVLARLTSRTDLHRNDKAVLAPAVDDPALQATVRRLRQQGMVVIEELPGQTADAAAMGCSLQLVQTNGWDLVPVRPQPENQ